MDAKTTTTLCCTACGALAEARCVCGVGYEPLTQRMERRQQETTELYKQGLTMQQIADKLKVGSETVRRDLSNFPNMGELKHPKSVTNPKGAGRPKGSKTKRKPKPPGVKQAQRSIDLAPDVWEQVKARAAAANLPAAAFIGQLLTVTIDPTIDPKTLSKTGQDKLAAAIRQAERRLRSEFEPLVAAEVIKRNKQTFPMLEKIEQEAKDAKRNYDQWFREAKKLGTVSEWNNLMFCLHPDTRRSASDQKFNTALAWVLSRKFAITGEK